MLYFMKWRVLPLKSNSGPMNMALDEAIAESVLERKSPPTIRFYGWQSPTISLGYRQKLQDDINIEACRNLGAVLVRRPTGGSAVLHLPSDLTYSVMVRDDNLPSHLQGKIKACYQHVCDYVIRTLQNDQIGLPAEQPAESPNDIRVYGCKISGNAQVRFKSSQGVVFLQHGTLLYDYDVDLLRKLIPDKNPGAIGWVKKWRDIPRETLYVAMVDAFTRGKEWMIGEISKDEHTRAILLSKEKYGNPSWTKKQGTVLKGSCYDHMGRSE